MHDILLIGFALLLCQDPLLLELFIILVDLLLLVDVDEKFLVLPISLLPLQMPEALLETD